MPRANRHRIPGQVWHITHRCHHRQFLLKFAKDRRAWVEWLYEARKRFGLCVLNYQVTSNHAHVLVLDRGDDEIASSMQLVAGRTGQDFNRRKARGGAFWEDRYHATAVDTDEHLARCLVYIDLNMVRAGVVEHPQQWVEAGYHEIQRARRSYRIIDRAALSDLLAVSEDRLASVHEEWVRSKLACRDRAREPEWSDAIAVGRRAFVEQVQRDLGARGRYRRIEEANGTAILREAESPYTASFHRRNAQPEHRNGPFFESKGEWFRTRTLVRPRSLMRNIEDWLEDGLGSRHEDIFDEERRVQGAFSKWLRRLQEQEQRCLLLP